MAAMESGNLDPETFTVDCKGYYWLPPYIRDWGVHGIVNMYQALAVSCNTFFQEAGRRAGKDLIVKVAHEFGLGQKTGIDLPHEAEGLLPTPQWKKEVNSAIVNKKYNAKRKEIENSYDHLLNGAATQEEKDKISRQKKNALAKLEAQYKIDYNFETTWQPYDTFNMSIGQGSNKYTVIQLANYVATIANGGNRMQPYLVQKVVSPSGQVIKEFKPHVVEKADIDPGTIQEMKKAMHYAVTPGGTAYYIFSGLPLTISGGAKTGTAQTGRVGDRKNEDYHGVFIAFAPFDDPEIAFAGVVEYGSHGSTSAGLICKAVFEQYFGVKNYLIGDQPPLENQEITSETP
jgi:penicillin-binding protein 2